MERKLDAIETVFTWGEQTLRALVALPAMEASPAPTGESARCAALAAPARMR